MHFRSLETSGKQKFGASELNLHKVVRIMSNWIRWIPHKPNPKYNVHMFHMPYTALIYQRLEWLNVFSTLKVNPSRWTVSVIFFHCNCERNHDKHLGHILSKYYLECSAVCACVCVCGGGYELSKFSVSTAADIRISWIFFLQECSKHFHNFLHHLFKFGSFFSCFQRCAITFSSCLSVFSSFDFASFPNTFTKT